MNFTSAEWYEKDLNHQLKVKNTGLNLTLVFKLLNADTFRGINLENQKSSVDF